MKRIVGILLAAGCSQRFGTDKRLYPLPDGTPMLLASVRHLSAACRRTLVVIRHEDRELAKMLAADGIETVICHEAQLGMGHSLSEGVASSQNADAWMVALADMPYIALSSYQAVERALENGADLARPSYKGKLGHPVGFSTKYRDQLLALTGDQGGKAILDAYQGDLQCCPVEDFGILKDVDQPSQVAQYFLT